MKTLILFLVLMFVLSRGVIGVSAQAATPTDQPCPPFPAGVAQDFTYYVGLGDSLFARSFYTDAAAAYTCAIKLKADYAPVYASRGFAYAATGDSDRALADYQQAIKLDQNYLPAYIDRGALYTRLGNFGLAINDLTLALTLDPNNVAALNDRAVVHAIEGNDDQALADVNAALKLDAKNAALYATRAAIYSVLASKDYQQFVAVSHSTTLPAGSPEEVLDAVDDSLRTGDFSIWLSLLTAASS